MRNQLADALFGLESSLVDGADDPVQARQLLTDAVCRVARARKSDADAQTIASLELVSAEDFAAVDEPGAQPLVGTDASNLIPQGSDVMVTGNGGAGKTTLTTDLAVHLAAGTGWLGLPIERPVRVLMVENEGPRPLFRKKLARKLADWQGSPLEGRLMMLGEPWGAFTFADDGWRAALASALSEQEIDVLIAGPVTRLGMNEAGTLQQTRDFMGLVADVRAKAERPVATVLVHHDNKAGNVSGAWEGAGDTLIHLATYAHGSTEMHIQKARWSPEHHNQKMKLTWADGESYDLLDDRDYLGEIESLLSDKHPRTVKEIMAKIGASEKTVKSAIQGAIPLERIWKLSPTQAEAAGREKVASNGTYYCCIQG